MPVDVTASDGRFDVAYQTFIAAGLIALGLPAVRFYSGGDSWKTLFQNRLPFN